MSQEAARPFPTSGIAITRNELIMTAVGAVVLGVFVWIETSGFVGVLGALSWFSNGANVIQWVSGPATFAAVIAYGYQYFVRRCAVPLCVRAGEHPVDSTLKKVCTHHHTTGDHGRVQSIYADAHRLSGKLGWNDSAPNLNPQLQAPQSADPAQAPRRAGSAG
jgi:hypothetical protein